MDQPERRRLKECVTHSDAGRASSYHDNEAGHERALVSNRLDVFAVVQQLTGCQAFELLSVLLLAAEAACTTQAATSSNRAVHGKTST